MKKFIYLLVVVCLSTVNYAQVAVGTMTPDDGSAFQIDSNVGAFVPPRMPQVDIDNIPTPLEGAIVYNTTLESLYTFNGNEWVPITRSLPTILLNKDNKGSLTLAQAAYKQFPVTSSDILHNDSEYFTFVNEGKIKVLKDGIYNINAGLSSEDFPVGDRKYVIGVFKNTTLVGYINRGVVYLDESDYWGVSGSFTYNFSANDVIDVRYVINKDPTVTGNQSASVRFVNLSISKIN